MSLFKGSWNSALVIAVFVGGPAFAQNPSTPPAATETAPAKAAPKKKKAKAKPKPAAEPEQPADLPPSTEVTKIEPELTYRLAALQQRKRSVYHKDTDLDQTDQIYAIARFSKLLDYQHEVVFVPRFRTLRENPVKYDDDYIEQAYVESQISSKFSLTAGKKAEIEGSGFIVNPSDLLNEKQEVFDPMYQKDGKVFVRFRYRLDDLSLGLAYIPKRGRSFDEGKAWLQASKELFSTDVRLQVTDNAAEKTTTGLSLQRFLGAAFELHYDGRYQTRQRNQELNSLTPDQFTSYSGPNTSSYEDDSPSMFNLVGSRFVITPKRTIVLEYIQNDSGLDPTEFQTYYTALRDRKTTSGTVSDSPKTLVGRHYVFTTLQDEESVKALKMSGYYLYNTDDQSVFSSVSFRYSLSPLTNVELVPTFFSGAVDSEFGEMPFSQATYLVFRGRF